MSQWKPSVEPSSICIHLHLSFIFITMRIFILFTLILLFWQSHTVVLCPASHFDFTGKYALGKQDEVNTTFTKIIDRLSSLPDTTFEATHWTYTIFNTKINRFYYRDSEQKATILGNDTIVINGGRLEAYLSFEWKKEGVSSMNGSGSVFGLSNPITIVKRVVMAENGSFFNYNLLDANKVEWGKVSPFSLTRIDPASVTDEDRNVLEQMVNRISETITLCDHLEEEIDKIYRYILGNSLIDEHMPLDGQFDYVWRPGGGKPNVTLTFFRRGIDVKLRDDGVRLFYEVQAVNDSQWKCGSRQVPITPSNPDIYGASQQFISFDFYENLIRNAIYNGVLDTDLSQENWQSRMFQFGAGDLYEVLDKVNERYYASEPVNGNCKASLASVKVDKGGVGTFNVSLNFDCELNIKRSKVVGFSVGLQLEVEGVPLDTSINFRLRSHQEKITLYPYSDYKILKEDLGKAMVSHSLNRLYGGLLFGSGWPLSPPRDYPHFSSGEGFTFVYDSSHVGNTQPQLL